MKNESVKTGMKIGAAVGGLVFLVFGIMPGFYFGSYGTLIHGPEADGRRSRAHALCQGGGGDGDRDRDILRSCSLPRGRRASRDDGWLGGVHVRDGRRDAGGFGEVVNVMY